MSIEIFSFLKIYGIDMQMILTLEVITKEKKKKKQTAVFQNLEKK